MYPSIFQHSTEHKVILWRKTSSLNCNKFDDLHNLHEVFAGEAYNPERDVLALSLHQYTRFNHQPKIAILPLTQIVTTGPTF